MVVWSAWCGGRQASSPFTKVGSGSVWRRSLRYQAPRQRRSPFFIFLSDLVWWCWSWSWGFLYLAIQICARLLSISYRLEQVLALWFK
ncbi:hypothetical protein BDA96_02G372800 [Sorghum bicolor]|uniref:Uncharacterized protein n=2 Tax=Sorghum bicolor TaxID=4558 RepID=A0A921UUX5_SORBI|nr:hypothetical protein BDA96_02G372800 [Sorghum bicolor]KXG36574.1 hypothetical protein SORBI_3002G355600 [Sorghum bicolor]